MCHTFLIRRAEQQLIGRHGISTHPGTHHNKFHKSAYAANVPTKAKSTSLCGFTPPQPNPKYTKIDTQMPATPAGFFASSLRYIAATTLNAGAGDASR
ncbi:hypothetical protein ACVIKP_000031 [Rhizobium leguminosarum]